jgi:phospholipase/carboxylesterase
MPRMRLRNSLGPELRPRGPLGEVTNLHGQGPTFDPFACVKRRSTHAGKNPREGVRRGLGGAARRGGGRRQKSAASTGSADAPIDLTVTGTKDLPVDLTVPLYPKRCPVVVRTNKRVTAEDPGEMVILPTGTHTHTVVLLHGMYCAPDKLDTFVNLPSYVDGTLGSTGVKFVYPRAPRRTISWPSGKEPNVESWYNYFTQRDGADCHDELDEMHLASQTSRLHAILDREVALLGGDASRVILGGSSQGGTVALHAALSYRQPLGGIICLRSLLVDTVSVPKDKRCSANQTPVFVFAAGQDTVYNPYLQRRGFDKLEAAGFRVCWHVEPHLDHWSDTRNELRCAGAWIMRAARGLELRPLDCRERARSPELS